MQLLTRPLRIDKTQFKKSVQHTFSIFPDKIGSQLKKQNLQRVGLENIQQFSQSSCSSVMFGSWAFVFIYLIIIVSPTNIDIA